MPEIFNKPIVSGPISLSDEVLAEAEKELLRRGRVIAAEDTSAPGIELRIDRIAQSLKQLARKQVPILMVADTVEDVIRIVDTLLETHGPGAAAPKGTFQPQADGLTVAVNQALQARSEHTARFYNVVFGDDVPALNQRTEARQRVQTSFTEAGVRIGNHLWPDELRLAKALSSNWTFMSPVFEGWPALKESYGDLFDYQTGRWERAAERRRQNAAQHKTWEADEADKLRIEADKQARARVAEDLSKIFVRDADDKGDKK